MDASEARVEHEVAAASVDAALDHFAAFPTSENRDVVDECISRYVRAAEARVGAELAAKLRTWGANLRRADVLTLLEGKP